MSRNFVEDTKMFFKFRLSKEDNDSVKCKVIKNYIKKEKYEIEKFYNSLHWDTIAISEEFCEILLNFIKNHKCNNKTLLIFLTDLITLCSLKNLDLNSCVCNNEFGDYVKSAINNLENDSEISIFADNAEKMHVFTALLGNYQFMDILVKYGLVKNFSRDCPFFKGRTMEILRHLL